MEAWVSTDFIKKTLANSDCYLGLVVWDWGNPQWENVREVDAAWYQRLPFVLVDDSITFPIPDAIPGGVSIYAAAVFDTQEKGTGNMLFYISNGVREFYLTPGSTLNVIFSE